MALHLVASLVLVLIVIVYLIINSRNDIEGFTGGPNGLQYCEDCNRRGKKGLGACLSCTNCGWCVDPNGYGSCVLGDYTGPYFADCAQFMFGGGVVGISGSKQPKIVTGRDGSEERESGSETNPFTVALPWTGNSSAGYINPSPFLFGNNFYGASAPLRSARRWRPTGSFRNMY